MESLGWILESMENVKSPLEMGWNAWDVKPGIESLGWKIWDG